MKRLIIFVLSFFALSQSIFAWSPDSDLMCHINMENMPDGAEYVDMLIPIDEEDESYTDFNEKNGEKFGIKPDSEIAKFADGGFQSYTFHTKDAFSEIKPFDIGDGWFYVWYYDHDIKSKDGKSSYDFFREKYKFVKFAYLDATGEIISTTNEVDIWGDTESTNIRVDIDGSKAVSEVNKRIGWTVSISLVVIGSVVIALSIIACLLIATVVLIYGLYRRCFIKK